VLLQRPPPFLERNIAPLQRILQAGARDDHVADHTDEIVEPGQLAPRMAGVRHSRLDSLRFRAIQQVSISAPGQRLTVRSELDRTESWLLSCKIWCGTDKGCPRRGENAPVRCARSGDANS
jgi:hypothetical protein